MIISDTAIKNRISVVVLTIILVIVGISCYISLPRENEPDVTIPMVFVHTDYKGVSSQDIETSITIPIEKKLKGIDGVKKIESVSSEGQSDINIEFMTDIDIDEALDKVKDKVDEAKNDLPMDLENDPAVFEVNFSEMPIVVFSISGSCGIACLKKLGDDLADDIESIAGVLEVEVTGGLEREIHIEVLPDKLAYYQIPITAFQQVVSSENQNTSGGSITLGDGRYQLQVPGEFESPEEIYNLVISSHEGRPIYLKDVARVKDGFKEETSRSRLNGQDAVNISVKKRSGENILAITEQVDKVIERNRKTWPMGTRITKLMDKAKDIRMMVADLENNIISGLILVVVVLLFTMGVRNALLVGIAIPFSMLISFAALYAFGITLNMVVLFSLSLALGMLVDNAIVIVENIYRFMEQGIPRIEAAMRATSEVAYPVIGSTITTLAAFFPMVFWGGIMGGFMKWLPITLIVTLTSSLFVAMVINPALTAIFMRTKARPGAGTGMSVQEVITAGEKPVEIKGGIIKAYSRLLNIALNNRISVLSSSVFMVGILMCIWFYRVGLERPVEFFPNPDPSGAYVNIDSPEGADLEYIDRIIRQVELSLLSEENRTTATRDSNDMAAYRAGYTFNEKTKAGGDVFYAPGDIDNLEHVYARAIENTSGANFDGNTPNHIGLQFIDYEDRKHLTVEDLETIHERVKNIPGAVITVAKREEGPPTGAPINIEISGEDFSGLGKLAEKVKAILETMPLVEDIQDDYVAGLPAIQVKLDRQKAALFGLSTNNIGFALKTAYNGLDVSSYHEGDDDYDITVILPEADRQVTDVLRKLMIPTPSGQLVPLTTIAAIDYSGTIGAINRINHERVVTVKANVDEAKIPGAVARAEAEELLKEFELPPGYQIKFTGEFEFQKESQDFLSRAFLIALFLIFLILVTLFNSVIQPLIILTSVLLSLGGVFLGLTLRGFPFGIIMSGVGVISLAGVVVNNAIVLIDYINKLRERGMTVHEAVVAAGATRLRPVMLTAITTVLGLLPMVTGISFDFHKFQWALNSATTQWWESMAIVVIFGLLLATFLTLVVVPTLYSLLDSVKHAFSRFGKRLVRMGGSVKRWYWSPFREV
ncbi:MAG: efflux RND transporter permease subunit [Desulfobacteraceae bacterium]|nr:efflux RND transporter permease subunit [Desulfobacteraceae bacterium]